MLDFRRNIRKDSPWGLKSCLISCFLSPGPILVDESLMKTLLSARSGPSALLGFAALTGSLLALTLSTTRPLAFAQDKADSGGSRGSIVEDRAARKLLEAGDARLDAGEAAKAVEVWQSVIERYPRSKIRFDSHLRLGNHLLNKERAFDRARTHFESASVDENGDEGQRAEATLKIGICFFEARNFGRCFKSMRDVIEKFPVSPQVNQSYYYIGLGHFQEGHYSRAIAALERVGTALPAPEPGAEKAMEILEAGKRFFVRIEDADLAALEQGKSIAVSVSAKSGDKEIVSCTPIGRNVRVVVGSIPTALGKPKPGNGTLEIRGGDTISIRYLDSHTAQGSSEKEILREVQVVGTGDVRILDGAFSETLQGVVLGRGINLQVTDADYDLTDDADVLKATVDVYREKPPEELAALDAQAAAEPMTTTKKTSLKLERYNKIDSAQVILKESRIVRETPPPPPPLVKKPALEKKLEPAPAPKEGTEKKDDAPKEPEKSKEPEPKAKEPEAKAEPETPKVPEGPPDDSIHTGIFRAVVMLEKEEKAIAGDDKLQALPNDIVVVTYVDDRNAKGEKNILQFKARCVEGSLGSVRVSETLISDEELRVRTQLKTASALTNIGNRYKEFGLKQHAELKYNQALALCEEVQNQAKKLGGRTLEETYVQLWKIYFEMDKLQLAAAVSQRLQREFPTSEFADAALVSLGDVARKQKDYKRAITIYNQVLRLTKSALRGEAQYGIAECYEELAKESPPASAPPLFDQAFQEYKKVFDQYPDSGRVGEAVAKMANYYYQQKDYNRAIDVFESVLRTHPDAKYLDVILFNYGRCLYRMEKKAEARRQFDQLLADFPESTLAPDAKKVAEALRKGGF